MKICNKCDKNKDLNQYSADSRNKDGLQGTCEDCRREKKRISRVLRREQGVKVVVTEKTCNECDKTKSVDLFFKDSGISDGYMGRCKECKTKQAMKWRTENRETYNANQRLQHKKNYTRNRLYRYDLTPAQYQQLVTDQNNLCAVCLKPPAEGKELVIDHCHDSEAVRGLLCYKCNRDMVVVDDDLHLTKLLAYKQKNR